MERWEYIPGYDNKYQVSTLGNVRVMNYRKTGEMRNMLLHSSRYGYKVVTLRQNGKNVLRSVHRLVALTFIPNPNNLPEIDHINTIRSDNRIENLVWCTKADNMSNPLTIEHFHVKHMNHPPHVLSEDGKRKLLDAVTKSVVCIDPYLRTRTEYESITQASKETGVRVDSISKCCNGKIKTAGLKIWRFKE